MRIVVLNTQVPFVRGGAEVLADTLVQALRRAGHTVELCALPFKWYPVERILDHMLAARLTDLSESSGIRVDRLICLKFPAYLAPHPHKIAWMLHQQRSAYELWGTEFGDLETHGDGVAVRAAIHAADAAALAEMRGLFTISRAVADRLWRYNHAAAQTVYPPPEDGERFYCAPAGDYLFYPSRLTAIKRQGLVLDALTRCRNPVKMIFCGVSDAPRHAGELAQRAQALGLGDRVKWLGSVSQDEKLRLYAECLGVVFVPFDEDLGYITMEAMLAAKPVVTCSDAGGPLEFVVPRETGLVSAPAAGELAEAFDELWENRGRAAAWGAAGREAYAAKGISWDKVVSALTA